MSDDFVASLLSRRDLIKAGMAAGVSAMLPWQRARAELPQVARNRTMILVWGGREGRWVDWDLWNPYSIGSNHQNGPNLVYEPLAYYSAFADKTYMWLAESYEFAPDFKRLTIKTRSGDHVERRPAVQRRGRRLHPQHAARPRPQGALGRRRAAGGGEGGGDRRQYRRDRLQDPGAAVLLLHDLQIRHRRLHRAEAHLRGAGLDHLQALRPGQEVAGHDRALAGRRRIAAAEGVRPPSDLVGGRAQAGATAGGRAQHLAALRRRAAERAGADHQPARCRHRHAAGHLPDRVPPEPEDHHPYRRRNRPTATWIGGRSRSTSTTSGRRSTTRTCAGR